MSRLLTDAFADDLLTRRNVQNTRARTVLSCSMNLYSAATKRAFSSMQSFRKIDYWKKGKDSVEIFASREN